MDNGLIPGRPRVVLFNPFKVYDRLGEIKYLLWEHHDISLPADDELINQVVAFGLAGKGFPYPTSRSQGKRQAGNCTYT